MSASSNPKNKTIAGKIETFEKLVAWFDTDDFSLEEALEKFKQAEKLAREIETSLAKIKNDVIVLKTKFSEPNE